MRKAVLAVMLFLCLAASVYATCFVEIITESLPTFYVGVPVNFQIEVWGGTEPYTFTLVGGSTMPDGLTLNADGTITGTPTEATFDTIFVRVFDAHGCPSTTKAFAVAVEY